MTRDEVLAAVDAQRDQLHLHIKIADDSPAWLEQMIEMAEKLRGLHSILLDLSEGVIRDAPSRCDASSSGSAAEHEAAAVPRCRPQPAGTRSLRPWSSRE